MALKAGRQINALQRLHKYLDFKSRVAIYKSFILANFNYCPLVWMLVNKTNFDILEKVQEKALRFIHNDYFRDKGLLLEQSNDIFIRLVTMRQPYTPGAYPVQQYAPTASNPPSAAATVEPSAPPAEYWHTADQGEPSTPAIYNAEPPPLWTSYCDISITPTVRTYLPSTQTMFHGWSGRLSQFYVDFKHSDHVGYRQFPIMFRMWIYIWIW